MTAGLSAVVVGADRLGNIPDLLKGHNISITHHISGRDPSHQKKTLQLPSGTQLVILLTDFLGHNVMKTFRNAAQRGGIRVVVCRRSVRSMQQALQQCGLCSRGAAVHCHRRATTPPTLTTGEAEKACGPRPRRGMKNAAGLESPAAFCCLCRMARACRAVWRMAAPRPARHTARYQLAARALATRPLSRRRAPL